MFSTRNNDADRPARYLNFCVNKWRAFVKAYEMSVSAEVEMIEILSVRNKICK